VITKGFKNTYALYLLLLTIFVTIGTGQVTAQKPYWIYLNERADIRFEDVSETTRMQRKSSGLPEYQVSDARPSEACLEKLKRASVEIRVISRWMNAVSANLTPAQSERLKQCDCVNVIEPIQTRLYPARISESGKMNREYLPELNALIPNSLISKNLNGKGVHIGIIDAGFYNADKISGLDFILKNNFISGARDFIYPERSDLFGESYEGQNHGTMVFVLIGGYTKAMQYGLATHSTYTLARTEDPVLEYRGEEDYWIAAMEWMDSLGIRLINTSLGYAHKFDNPEENYLPQQMDGKTSAIARAADIAVYEKGILLIHAAGNNGEDKTWKYIATPSDAKGVLSVGSTTQQLLKTSYSGIGPEFNAYLKPEVSAPSDFGTSLSAPLITGFAACLWQYKPELSNLELKEIICASAHLYPFGNNYIGYGIPKANKALALIDQKENKRQENVPYSLVIHANKKNFILSDIQTHQGITLFHKSNTTQVFKQEFIKSKKNKYKIIKPKDARFTTVYDEINGVREIAWP